MSDSRTHVELVIAAHNEASDIQGTLDSVLGQQLGDIALHVCVVANACSDDTVPKAEAKIGAFNDHSDMDLSVVTTEIPGKAHALNMGLNSTESDLVMTGDADISYAPDCFARVVHNLMRPGIYISGPLGAPKLPNPLSSRLQQVQGLKQLRRRIDTKLGPNGPLMAFRRGVIPAFPEDIASEDTWLNLTVAREIGFEAISVDPEAGAWFQPPTNWHDFIQQEARFRSATAQLLKRAPELQSTFGESQSRRLPSGELDQRVAKCWEEMGYSPEALDTYAKAERQIEAVYRRGGSRLVRDSTWDQVASTKRS
jgi:glycosyltransferase involved in cell wall biosynthesis